MGMSLLVAKKDRRDGLETTKRAVKPQDTVPKY